MDLSQRREIECARDEIVQIADVDFTVSVLVRSLDEVRLFGVGLSDPSGGFLDFYNSTTRRINLDGT